MTIFTNAYIWHIELSSLLKVFFSHVRDDGETERETLDRLSIYCIFIRRVVVCVVSFLRQRQRIYWEEREI